MMAGAYTLDLYCDGVACVEGPAWKAAKAQYVGETKAEAFRKAKRAGWGLGSWTEAVLCPSCHKQERRNRK